MLFHDCPGSASARTKICQNSEPALNVSFLKHLKSYHLSADKYRELPYLVGPLRVGPYLLSIFSSRFLYGVSL